VAIELGLKAAVGLRKLNVKLLPLLPGCALAGRTCMLPSPFPSVIGGRGGERGGVAGGGGLERGALKLFGENVPATVEFTVLVGHHVPRFERLLDGVCFDHNHVDGFAGLESGAVEIDVRKGRVIFLIGGEGRLLARRLVLLGRALD
jgi:hypothetical protein